MVFQMHYSYQHLIRLFFINQAQVKEKPFYEIKLGPKI